MNAFDKGFLKRASQAGVHPTHAQEALAYIKQASPITGKAAPAQNQSLGDAASQKSLQAPATPAAAQQRMAMPRPQLAPQLQPRIAPQVQPQLAPQVAPVQGPPMPMQLPQPQIAQQVQPKLAPQMQPKLAPQMAPGPLRPPTMPQMNQPMLAPRQ